MKLGTTSYEELKEFSSAIEEALFKLTVPREKSQVGYKTDEVQMTAVDEFYVEQDKMGRVLRQIARVRVFVLSFLSGTLRPNFFSFRIYLKLCICIVKDYLTWNWVSMICLGKAKK